MHRFSTAVIWGKRLKTAAWGFHHLNPWGREGQTYTTSCWVTTPLPWCLGWSNHTAKENWPGKKEEPTTGSPGWRVVEDASGILVSRFRVPLGTMEQRLRVVGDIVGTCVVLYNIRRTHKGGVDRAPTPGNDVVAQKNEQAVYVQNENYGNPLREAKHPEELLKDYFNHMGALAGLTDRSWDVSANQPVGRSWHLSVLFRTTISPFQD